MVRYVFAVVSMLSLVAAVSLVLLFSSQNSVGLASLERCSLPTGFEENFASKRDCELSLVELCANACHTNVGDCVAFSARDCRNIGKTVVRAFR